MPQEIIFKPKYGFKIKFGLFCLIALTLFAWIYPIGNNIEIFVCKVGLLAFILWLPFDFTKKIILSDKIIVERFFLPPKTLRYEDIQEIGSIVYLSKGNINLQPIDNSPKFLRMLIQRMKELNIGFDEFEHSREDKRIRLLACGLTAMMIAAILMRFGVGPNIESFLLRFFLMVIVAYLPAWLFIKYLLCNR